MLFPSNAHHTGTHARRSYLVDKAAAVVTLSLLLLASAAAPAQSSAAQAQNAEFTVAEPTGGAATEASPVHVHDLIPIAKDLPNGRWRASVTIRVRDASENEVGGVTVTGDFAGLTRSCVTNSTKGGCVVSRIAGDLKPQPRFTVTDLDAPGGYDAGANHDATGNDSDGTRIRVHQPLDTEPTHHVFTQDKTFTSRMKLRPGDTVELRNGARLSFAQGGYADWVGTPTSTWSDDGAIQNLNRNVRIFGNGDIRFEHGSQKSVIRYVEVDLRPSTQLGHYPLHWHHAGDGSRGTMVRGVVVKNSTNRAYVPHASHGITFIDNIAKNVTREGFWWDPPCECDGASRPKEHTGNNSNDTTVVRMLVDGARPPSGDDGHSFGAYELGAGSGNVIRGSVAMNVDGGKNSSGFHWPSQANQNVGGTVWIFKNNRAYNVNNGAFIWQNDSGDHVIKNFKAWNVSRSGVEHGAYVNNYRYVGIDVDSMFVHSVGWTAVGGRADEVSIFGGPIAGTVRFTGTDIERVVLRNGSGKEPSIFRFKNTGLTCGDVEVLSKYPGTKIYVDGQNCNV